MTTLGGAAIRRIARLALLMGMPAAVGCCEPLPPCFVDLPVFGPTGDELEFEIVSVSVEGMPGVDLLSTTQRRHRDYRVFARGSRLYYGRILVFKWPLQVTFRDVKGRVLKGGRVVTQVVPMFDCHQRFSLQIGEVDTGSDVSPTRIEGRIVGCELNDDWWIRALPMFGGQEMMRQTIYDGYIDRANGSFRIQAPMRGERHIVIFGKGKEFVHAIAVNVTAGKPHTDVGVLDLNRSCPK